MIDFSSLGDARGHLNSQVCCQNNLTNDHFKALSLLLLVSGDVEWNPGPDTDVHTSEERTLELPALGRPMQLGMLYDCRNDTLIPGFTLWDPDVLKNDLDVHCQQGTQCNILASDNIDDKSSALNIDASLKASFMGGLVEVRGAADYINDRKTTRRQSRLTLQYKTTTRFEQLTMKHLGRHNVQHADIFERGTGTHVVTGILYGAQAFFVFDRYLKNDEKVQRVNGHVNAIIDKIPTFSIKGEGDLRLSESEKEEAEKLQCKFYGDFAPKSNPTSYEEAVRVYAQLPSLLGDNGEHAVPLMVWLYPLSKLDSTASRLFREISMNIIGQVHDILQRFDEWKMRCDDMARNSICIDFPNFTENLDRFRKLIIDCKKGFQQKIARVMPMIRGGEDEEEVLINIISNFERSPFNFTLVENWLKCKDREMNIVRSFINGLSSLRIYHSQDELNELLFDFSVKHVVSFSFSSLGLEDEYLNVLSRFTKTQSQESYSPQREWFGNLATLNNMSMRAKQFKEFAEVNSESKETAFVITGFHEGKDSTAEGGSLFHYNHTELITTDFDPPGLPGKPEITNASHDSVMLKWTKPDRGLACIQSYIVKYREASRMEDPEWDECKTDSTATSYTVPNLKPDTTYDFLVASDCEIGHSQFVKVKKVATTLPTSPPYDVRKNHVSKSSITVVWNKPDMIGGEVSLIGYTVSYVQSSDGDPDHPLRKETEGKLCLFTIEDLEPDTTYKVSVSALCTTKKSSAFSKPIEITTLPAVSERLLDIDVLLTKCVRLTRGNSSKGEPSVYKLPLEKGMLGPDGKYRTYNFGRMNHETKQHLVVMVVGATGAGKSTLINGMINYIFNVEWNDDFRFKIIAEEGENAACGQAHSQTQMITSYTINPSKLSHLSYRLTIIDTPGFGDTRGIAHDKAIIEQIRYFFSDSTIHHVDHIDVIGFVAQSSLARLTPTQMYVFQSVLAIFGRDIKDNFMLLVTFADGQKPPVIEAIKAAEMPCSENSFKFNNSALFAKRSVGDQSSNSEGVISDYFDKMFWKMGVQSMRHFFHACSKIEPKSLLLTQEVLRERKNLETLVLGLQLKIQMGCGKLDELLAEQRVLEQHEAQIQENKNFTYTVEVHKSQKIPISGSYITNCSNCHFSCHHPCAYGDDREKINCCAIDNEGYCRVCPRKCIWSDHYNQPYKFEFYTENETRTYAELESRYISATGKKLTVEQVLKKLKEEFAAVEKCVFHLIKESERCLKRLDEIALRSNPLSTVDYVDILIQSEQQDTKPGWKRRVEALLEVRKAAEVTSQIKEDNFHPFEEYKKNFGGNKKTKKGPFETLWDYVSPFSKK